MDSWVRIFAQGLRVPRQYGQGAGLSGLQRVHCLSFVLDFGVELCNNIPFLVNSVREQYKNASYRNHRPVLHSRQSTTPDMDPIPGASNSNETNESRDHEGTVREAHEGTDTRVLLRQQTTLPRPR